MFLKKEPKQAFSLWLAQSIGLKRFLRRHELMGRKWSKASPNQPLLLPLNDFNSPGFHKV